MIHNPTTNAVTVAVGEPDGDPFPRLSFNLAAGGFADLPGTGVLFVRGIMLLESSGPLTFAGRSLD
jgi:hypothetical protein